MSNHSKARRRQDFFAAVGFLLPNLIGVATFVVFPLLFSILLAFTNWDLRRHNIYQSESLEFVGLNNFIRLITEADFIRFLGNTLFLMMAIPFSVGGSLLAAILLSKDPRGGSRNVFAWLLAGTVLIISISGLVAIGLKVTGLMVLIGGLSCGVLLMGLVGGRSVYRTLFYMPHFTAGVATFLLWKKVYNPQTGPINNALEPVLSGVTAGVNAVPSVLIQIMGWLVFGLILVLLWWTFSRMRRMWNDGDIGTNALIVGGVPMFIPFVMALIWSATQTRALGLVVGALVIVLWQGRYIVGGRLFGSPRTEGLGSALILGLAAMVGEFVLLGLALVLWGLPAMAENGLEPPDWIYSYYWAKPSLMMVMLWASIGSNNMLLYLAALTNVPQDLYEAADIDGGGRLAKFWYVTWPQLAPTTFFIAVMSTIHGLQGGFEIARTMTQGGPAGATTTLSYFIYEEGFQTGRLSFASATAWALFMLVFLMTMFNWKFGNKYVND